MYEVGRPLTHVHVRVFMSMTHVRVVVKSQWAVVARHGCFAKHGCAEGSDVLRNTGAKVAMRVPRNA